MNAPNSKNSHQQFNWGRLTMLLRNEVLSRYKIILQASGVILILAAIQSIAFLLDADSGVFLISNVVLVLSLIAAVFFTSISFNDMHDQGGQFLYLLLPSSNLEKYLAKYLLTGPILFVAAILLSQLAETFSRIFVTLFVDEAVTVTRLFDAPWYVAVAIFFAWFSVHSLLFLGAILIRKNSFPITIIAGFLFFLSLLAAYIVSIKLLFWSYFESFFSLQATSPILDEFSNFLEESIFTNLYILIPVWFILYTWVLFMAYISLQEHEI